MHDVQREIRDWLHQQPDWLQEAAETLLSSGTVSDAEIQNLVDHMKTPAGQDSTSHRPFGGLASSPSVDRELRLLQISDVIGIESLGPNKPLGFGTGNLCVIYGHNGSGKSGYTRLLKRASGKPRATELRHHVFRPPPAARSCKIDYSVSGVVRQVEWEANGLPVDDLRSVDIFDAETARFYLASEVSPSYTPRSVALFEALAGVCDRVKARLQSEQDRLVSSLPVLPSDYRATRAGTAYSTLRADSDEITLQSLTEWRDEDDDALLRLTERLAVDDPGMLAKTKRNTKLQLDKLAALLRSSATSLSDERVSTIRTLRDDALQKRRVAAESAQVDLARLDGIGAATWRALWEAARLYTQTAYPGREFPVTDDALCVLCHQELGQEAQERLQGFDAFVKGTLETEAVGAEDAYRQALLDLPTALTDDTITTWTQAAGITEDGWLHRLSEYWGQISDVREALLDGEVKVAATPIAMPKTIIGELSLRSEALEREAAQHDQDAASFDRAKAVNDRLDLEARRWTAQQSEPVTTEVARLRRLAEYETWKRLASSQRVSVKAGEVAERVITEAFVDRFNRELKALGASRIRVELVKARTEKGRALHKLRLKGALSGQDLPDSVLSDGERRIVGLAAFLADVVEQANVAPFVFDDPISSLDHDFEWCVAARLAELAQSRQVLVFTHRLSLYGALEDAAKKFGDPWKKQHLHQHCIETFSGVAGQPADQATWNANTAKANNILLDRLTEAKKAGEASGAEAYTALAQAICSDFRKLLERTVEDDLLSQVVRRHRRSVTTENRLALLPRIRQSDCKFIDDLMSKYSFYAHSQSLEAPSFLPEEPELREDLEALKKWRDEFTKRPMGPPA